MADDKLKPHSKNELLTSGAPKRTAYTVAPVNPGMSHVAHPVTANTPGLVAHGISRTEATRLLGNDQIGEVHGGGETTTVNLKRGHKPGNVPLHPGVTDAQRANYKDNGGAMLGEAILSGSTQIPPAINATIDDGKPTRLPDCPKE